MVTHLVCQCGNDIAVPESDSGGEFRCSRCGRLLHVDPAPPSSPSTTSGNDETFVYTASDHDVGGHHASTSVSGSASASGPHNNSSAQTIEYWGAGGGSDVVGLDAARINDHLATQIAASSPTPVVYGQHGYARPDDLVLRTPNNPADDDETRIAETLPASSANRTSSDRHRDGSWHTSLDLSLRVMDTISDPPAPPLTALDASGIYGIHQVLRTHQKGGMGKILIAYDQYLKRDVALKELHPEVATDESIVRRFIGEAEITAQLEHPGIVPIHTLNLDKNGNPYYTMKLIKGRTFQDAIKAYHRNPNKQELMHLVRRLVSICKTMAFAHNKGVIHRDLKPANIMLGEHGETLVMDWGLAKPFNQVGIDSAAQTVLEHKTELRPDLTMVGAIVGTPAFMSPEQAMPEGHVVGPLADVFSLGTILYYLLAGQTAFSGRSTQEVLKKVRAAAPPKPSELKSNVPPGLEAICAKAMAKEPADRYQSAAEMDLDLCRWLDGEPVLAQKETILQKIRYWIDKHRFISISTPLILILVIALTTLGIQLDRIRRDRSETTTIDSILRKPVDLTDESLVAFEGSPGVTVTRTPRQTGGTMIVCSIDQPGIVSETQHGFVEIEAPLGNFWDLSQRKNLNFSLFEGLADGNTVSMSMPREQSGFVLLTHPPTLDVTGREGERRLARKMTRTAYNVDSTTDGTAHGAAPATDNDATLSRLFVRLGRGSSYYEYRPTEEFWNRRKRSNWFPFSVPLGQSTPHWTRMETDASPALMSRIEWIEFHFEVTKPMTIQLDHVFFEQ